MRRLFILLALAVSLLSAGMALAQKTPPGADTLGSDHPVARNGVRSEPTATPDANQRLTNTSGSSSGYEANPAFAGSSSYGTAAAVNNDRSGMHGQAAATAARRRAYRDRTAVPGARKTRKKGQKAHPKPHPQGDVPY